MVELVTETCQKMMATNETFRQQTVEYLSGFISSPLSRTADVVADLPVLVAQALSWNSLTDEEKTVEIADPQAAEESIAGPAREDFKKFSRFAVEEIMRRQLKTTDSIGKTAILKLLAPEYATIVAEFKAQTQKSAEDKLASGAGDSGSIYGEYEA